MAELDVFPRRGLGASEYWGRVVENRLDALAKKRAQSSSSIDGVGRANTSQYSGLSQAITELNRQYELLEQLYNSSPASTSGTARVNGYSLNPGWQTVATANLTVPSGKTGLNIIALGVSKLLDPGTSAGNFSWPFPEATITSEYGPRDGSFHYGTDFGIGSGTPIPASNNGTVIANGSDGSRGNYINVSHPGGVETRHFHLVTPSPLGVGTPVTKGQTIGQVGNTGNSFGAHLHWETLVGGTHWNPRDFMAAYGTTVAYTTVRGRLNINGVASREFHPYKNFYGSAVYNYIYPLFGVQVSGTSASVSYEMWSSEAMSYHPDNFVNLSAFGVFS